MAQLGARLNGIEKVVGSNPTGSTKMHFPREVLHKLLSGSSRLSAREVKPPAESFTSGARRAPGNRTRPAQLIVNLPQKPSKEQRILPILRPQEVVQSITSRVVPRRNPSSLSGGGFLFKGYYRSWVISIDYQGELDMVREYQPSEIESKWQRKWEEDGLYSADIDQAKKKFYALTMLPYPSGDLHIGHWYAMAPSDARARFKRMQGYNVLFPMGFDAFGLPAENAAISRGIHPKEWTYQNIDRMRAQLRSMGTIIDWRREAISADPEYYHWTQWFFIQLYNHGQAYRKYSPVDWCPKCNTTLAREQVHGDDRHCERCGTQVIKKDLEQWFFKTTDYADELIRYTEIDWPDRVRTLQTNWVGRSEGADVHFRTEDGDDLTVFTTRPDTLWGATFMVLAPEHPLVEKVTTPEHQDMVEAYQTEAQSKTEIQRAAVDKEKTGVFTGGYAINPVNEERIPIWIADYVMMSYGYGAIMAVPAHDERDFAFARQYDLKIIPVIQPEGEGFDGVTMAEAYIGPGLMINSAQFDGTVVTDDKGRKNPGLAKVIDWLEAEELGKEAISYKLRDWLISRQRYWGAPIPMVYCEECGWNPVPEEQLPVLLPDDVEWLPTGESPLKLHPSWKDTTCPACGKAAVRETDTMDTFMCSSWYHLRYLSPWYNEGPFDPKEYDYWMPVDIYTGGIEHATMHLMYTRYFHKALRDMNITEGHEPMVMLRNQGMVLGDDGEAMSKSRGNVVAPDDLVDEYGADTVRAYLMFFARWDLGGPWNSQGISGSERWLYRVWKLVLDPAPEGAFPQERMREIMHELHTAVDHITRDYERVEFNTIISTLMELLNHLLDAKREGAGQSPEWKRIIETYLLLMAPAVPHIAEELWTEVLGNEYSIHNQRWPEADPKLMAVDEITLIVQVNGKLRDRITVPADISQEEAEKTALESPGAAPYLEGKTIRKVVVVPGRLVNIVV
jgi:leucyl-tRNA synthetase